MKTKLALLASCAVAAISLATPVQAASNLYFSLFGGGNWLADDRFRAATNTTSSADTLTFNPDGKTGFIVGAAIGYHLTQIAPGLRLEAEAAYRQTRVKGSWVSNTGTPTAVSSGTLDYDHSTFSVMANAWYDFPIADVTPYIGGGIGWAKTELDGDYLKTPTGSRPLKFDDSGFAWQLGAGINFDISPSVQLGIGYRYFRGPDVTIASGLSLNSATGNVNDEDHSVLANLNFRL